MTGIQPQTSSSKRKLHSLKVDMTPMVDLGFLLITFFIFTTALAKPTVMKIMMPKEGEHMPVPASKSLTLLLDKNNVYVYNGTEQDAIKNNTIRQTTYDVLSGSGNLIRQKQTELNQSNEKDKLVVLIKPLPLSNYQNVINVLDEMQINGVKHYAIVDASVEEKVFLAKRQ